MTNRHEIERVAGLCYWVATRIQPRTIRGECTETQKQYATLAGNQLLGTALHESAGLQYRRQLGNGPARGLWQMEPPTAVDICQRYLEGHSELDDSVIELLSRAIPLHGKLEPAFLQVDKDALAFELEHNDIFACVFARLHYLRCREAIPDTLDEQAELWKLRYNTIRGKGTTKEYVNHWHGFIGVVPVTMRIGG